MAQFERNILLILNIGFQWKRLKFARSLTSSKYWTAFAQKSPFLTPLPKEYEAQDQHPEHLTFLIPCYLRCSKLNAQLVEQNQPKSSIYGAFVLTGFENIITKHRKLSCSRDHLLGAHRLLNHVNLRRQHYQYGRSPAF